MTAGWQLAQINVAPLVAPEGEPRVTGFFAQLDEVNALAEASPGFVWRLKGEGNNATDLQPTPDPLLIVNMSLWQSADLLFDYVYRSEHVGVMRRRREWVERYEGAFQALWWVAGGHEPGVDEGLARLWMLDRYGSSANAFTFKAQFPAPDAAVRRPEFA
jgi:hypothetical protein